MNILITGGTGFLGQFLIRDLAALYENVYVLTRKLQSGAFMDFPNVHLVQGDVTNFDVLNSEQNKSATFLDSINVILHAAALYDLEASFSECFLQNVVGTQNMLNLAQRLKNLKAFYHVSTIAVGDPTHFFLEENELPKRSKFRDAYSETKYLAELMVRENSSRNYCTRIFRPGIIIGDRVTKQMPKIDGPYYFIEAYRKHAPLLRRIPIAPLSYNPRSKIPLIPVDDCSRFIKLLIERDDYSKALKTYHLVASELPTVQVFLKDLNLKFGVNTSYIPVGENRIHSSLLNLLGIPKEVLPFMFSKLSYDKTSTLEDLPEILDSTYSAFKDILFG